MDINVSRELAALQRLTLPQLRQRYAELFGEATTARNRTWITRRLAWRIQALAEGDLSERARQRAQELANDADLRTIPPRTPQPNPALERTQTMTVAVSSDERLPPAGTILTRRYKGRTLQVQILDNGFAYENQVFPSLSALARHITGSHCNGFLFFRRALNGNGGDA